MNRGGHQVVIPGNEYLDRESTKISFEEDEYMDREGTRRKQSCLHCAKLKFE